MKRILTDIDDSVLQYADVIQKWLEGRGLIGEGRLRDTCSIETFLGVERHIAHLLVREFTQSEEIKTQPPEPDALEVLPELYRDGYRFVAVTACGSDPAFRLQRKKTLEDTFGFPWEIYTVELRASKMKYLKKFPPAVFVEDNVWHAAEGSLAGHRTFLVDRPYNQFTDEHYPEITRVASWRDIANQL